MKIGKLFKLGLIDDDGFFRPFAFAQSCSYDLTTNFVTVSSPLTGGVECVRPKRNGWVMQHEGLLGRSDLRYKIGGRQYTFMAMLTHVWKNKIALTARWVESTPDGEAAHDEQIKQGQCYIKSLKQVANEKALTKVSMSLQGTGELQDLSIDSLTGAFAYSIQGHTLTLYAVTRPVAGFSVHAGTTSVGTWDATATGRTQSFTNDAILANSRISAWRGDGETATEQPGVTFADSSTLHVVLLQTEERDSMQQLHRFVQPLWWGGLAMGDMTLTKNGTTVATFAIAGQTGSAPRVEIDATIDITGDGTWALTTDAPQTLHCTDRTTTLQRTLRVAQTTSNVTTEPYIVDIRMEPQTFFCPSAIWGNDDNGVEAFSVNGQALPTMAESDTLLPDAQHLHWQLTGLGADDGGPYAVQRELVTDTASHEVWWAYDATAQKMRIWCPDQEFGTVLLADGLNIHEGLLYDTDGEGNRVPLTLTGVGAFSALTTGWGDYHFNDVSSLTVLNLSNTLTISALPLNDIVLTGAGGTEVGRIPALSDPSVAYPTYEVVTTPGAVVTGAQMETGAAQSLTYQAYSQTVRVRATATQTGEDAWTINVSLRNSDGTAATLPGDLRLRWGSNAAITIAAGQGGTSASVDYNPSWIAPTATLVYPKADDFNIFTAQTPDITHDHWTAYKLGLVNGSYYYDIAYTGLHVGIALSGSFMFTGTIIAAGQEVADALYVATGSSEDNISLGVRAANAPDWSIVTIGHVSVNTTDKLVLSYRIGEVGGTAVTNLTNIKEYASGGAVYSRHSRIGDILPFVGAVWRTTTTVYNRVGLEGLKPGTAEAFEAQALYGIYSGDDSASDVRAVFSDSNGNTISVGTGLTGVNVLAVNHGAELPFA